MPSTPDHSTPDFKDLAQQIKRWGQALGFQQLAITDIDLGYYENRMRHWLDSGYHGSMGYLERNLNKRFHPDQLVPGTQRVISARMDYLSANTQANTQPLKLLQQGDKGYISRYALGRDYHKLMRKRLARLADRINEYLEQQGYIDTQATGRAFVDSAPVLEKPLAEKAGLGWIGKNTLLLNRQAGSWFFLGEIFIDLALPLDEPAPYSPQKDSPEEHPCGACKACINICPTNAILGPGILDARRCIAYLTIENPGPIPTALRSAIGNRIFGCDDCQLICPWNRYASYSTEEDFQPRHGLDRPALLDLFQTSAEGFLRLTEGSALRRIKFWQWLRNLSIALGNAPYNPDIVRVLKERLTRLQDLPQSELLGEHIGWAIRQQKNKASSVFPEPKSEPELH